MKKEFYEKPLAEINEFETVDILTLSGDGEETTNPGDDNETTFPFG